jgi:hypothetical protein
LKMFEALESKWGIINTRIARALSCWPKWEQAQPDLECVVALLSGIDLPLERQMVERISKTYVPQLNPLNFV